MVSIQLFQYNLNTIIQISVIKYVKNMWKNPYIGNIVRYALEIHTVNV